MNKIEKQKIEQILLENDCENDVEAGITGVTILGTYWSDNGSAQYTLIKFKYNDQRMYASYKEDETGLYDDKVSIRTRKQIESNAMIQCRKPNLD